MDLTQLPSPFYRVSLKAIILDDQKRLLLGQADNGHWEVPGGGWEYPETLEQGLRRELSEELDGQVNQIGDFQFLYKGMNPKGYMVVYLAFTVTLKNLTFKLVDELSDTRFVTKDELLELEFDADEALIKEHVDSIWPSA